MADSNVELLEFKLLLSKSLYTVIWFQWCYIFYASLKRRATEQNGENLPSQSDNTITRPRDLRSSKKKSSFSRFLRTSTSRCSLGAASQTWFEAAERLEAEDDAQLYTTWPRKGKTFIVTNDDASLDYNEDLAKGARLIPLKGPIEIERTGFKIQPVCDKSIQ